MYACMYVCALIHVSACGCVFLSGSCMRVCMYVRMCVDTCIYMCMYMSISKLYACMHVCMCVDTFVLSLYENIRVCIRVYIYTSLVPAREANIGHIFMHAWGIYMHACMYTRTYTCIKYTYIHKHTYTYIHQSRSRRGG